MSYARFGCDGSDVYVYRTAPVTAYVCCSCRLATARYRAATDFITGTPREMVVHLCAHRASKHTVPEYAIDRLVAEAKAEES